jgi:hypothetical protein
MADAKTMAFLAAATPKQPKMATAAERFRSDLNEISDARVAESRLLAQAEDAETDKNVSAHFEEAHQRYMAIARITEELQAGIRSLVSANRELDDVVARINDRAAAAPAAGSPIAKKP